MRKSIIAILFIILTFNTAAAEVYDLQELAKNVATLRYCLGILVSQLMEILIMLEWEPVDPKARSVVTNTIEICKQIMKLLEYK